MAASIVTPATYLNGYSSPASNILQLGTQDATLKLVPELTTAEANATTGDIRKIFWGLCQMMYQSANYIPDSTHPIGNLSTPRAAADSTNASTDTTRKASGMTASLFSQVDTSTGSPIITQTFNFSFKVGASGLEVVSE